MLNGKVFCLLLFIVWQLTDAARLPIFELAMERGRDSSQQHPSETQQHENVEPARAHMREGIPPPLCAGRVCAAPPAGPVCAFDAAGTARTFKTICELEAVSCRESTLYAITSLGEC